ncbi:protease II [Bradyrhizobium sp. JR3.5]
MMRWLKQLEAENSKLEKLVADLSLDKEQMLQTTCHTIKRDRG